MNIPKVISFLLLILVDSCESNCPLDFYHCPGTLICIGYDKVCNGAKDCPDWHDEVDCLSNLTRRSDSLPCNGFTCSSNGACLDKSSLCNGSLECPEGEDEINCSTFSTICSFNCTKPSTQCLPHTLVCDGKLDCDDGSDEVNCSNQPPNPLLNVFKESSSSALPLSLCSEPNIFKCYSGECIDLKLACDGVSNCPDGEDEREGCFNQSTDCLNKSCSHNCVQEPWGARCTCHLGYKLLADGLSCEDFNECELPPTSRPCFHECINTLGGYRCSCFDQYHLVNGTSCQPRIFDKNSCSNSSDDPFLLISTDYTIEKIHFDCIGITKPTPLPIKKFWVGSFTFDWKSSKIWAYNIATKKIVMINSETGSIKTFIKSNQLSDTVDGLTYDDLSGNLYWILPNSGKLQIASTQDRTILNITGGLEDGHRLALNQDRDEMYIATFGLNPRILVAGLDGSGARLIDQVGQLGRPSSLFVDKIGQRLFWTDSVLGEISYISVAGIKGSFGPQTIIRSKMVGIFSLIVHDDTFYLTNHERSLYRVSLHRPLESPSSISIPNSYKKFIDPNLVYAINENYSSPCLIDKGGCSHICVMINHRVTCLCPAGQVLDSSRRRCTPLKCAVDELMCSDGSSCFNSSHRCDDKFDCRDHSDELNCMKKCEKGYERCPDGDCIPKEWICDGFFDCPGGSDELNCKNKKGCGPNFFDCGNSDCIKSAWVCDGIVDCPNSKDEKECAFNNRRRNIYHHFN